MNAALCQAVTGELASQDLLETLERGNLFVVPLDEQRQWYRLHDLFREALLVQVETLVRRQEEPTARLDAEEALPALPDTEVAVLQRRLRLLRALIATRAHIVRGDAEGLRQLAQEIEGLSEQEEVSWKMISLYLAFWLTESLQREGALLITRLLEAQREALEALDQRAAVRVRLWLAFAYLRAGRLRLIEQECLKGLSLVEQIGEQTAMTGYLHYLLANTYYAWNRLEEASGSLQQALR